MVRFAETHRAIRPSSELFRFARAVGWTPRHYLPLTVPWPDGRETELNLRVLTSRQASDYSRYWFACPKCGRRSGALYAESADEGFLCRWCKKLRYCSQYRHRPRAVEALAAQEGYGWVTQALARRRYARRGRWRRRVGSARVRLRLQVARSERA